MFRPPPHLTSPLRGEEFVTTFPFLERIIEFQDYPYYTKLACHDCISMFFQEAGARPKFFVD